jgi:DNA repair exonuclease SbcCD nuclease subunit
LRLAVIADTHLGSKWRTKWGTTRGLDSFDQAEEAVSRALELGAQLILMPGDIFDTRIPRPEVWAKAMRVMTLPSARPQGVIKPVGSVDKNLDEVSPIAFRGVPVIAIRGNHERRTRGLVNPVEALESAGLMVNLHCNSIVLSTPDGGKLAIHGMGNVPEQHARNVISTWNPKPVKDAFNICILHQAIGQYVFSTEESPSLDLTDLPPGFDLYLCGHVHCHAETTVHGSPLLFPGSTERTQLLQAEAQTPKGFYLVDIDGGLRYQFIELKSIRDFHYEELEFRAMGLQELIDAIRTKVREILSRPRRNNQKLPLVRLKLRGTLREDVSRVDFDQRAIEEEFSDEAILILNKNEFEAPGLIKKIQALRELREKQLPLDELAMQLLDANLQDLGYSAPFDVRALYGLLAEGREGEAMQKVVEMLDKLVEAESKEQKGEAS